MNVNSPMVVISLALVILCGCGDSKKNFDQSFKKSFEKVSSNHAPKVPQRMALLRHRHKAYAPV